MFSQEFDLMLYVRDVGRSVAFYRDLLGFDFQGWWSEESQEYVQEWAKAGSPGYAELSAGALRLSLHGTDEEVPSGGCMFHVGVLDVDAYQSQIAAKSAQSNERFSPPRDEPWGWRMFTIEDPDGHSWGFYTPLGRKV